MWLQAWNEALAPRGPTHHTFRGQYIQTVLLLLCRREAAFGRDLSHTFAHMVLTVNSSDGGVHAALCAYTMMQIDIILCTRCIKAPCHGDCA